MLRTIKTILALGLIAAVFASPAMAESQFPFPSGWQNWIKVKEYKFPCDDLAPQVKVVQNVGTIYCPLFTEKTMISIYVRPEAEAALGGKAAEYPDGPNLVFSISEVKGLGHIIFVKGHDLGEPVYGVFKVDGTDIEGAAEPIGKKKCISCHDAYCRPHGVCFNQKWEK